MMRSECLCDVWTHAHSQSLRTVPAPTPTPRFIHPPAVIYTFLGGCVCVCVSFNTDIHRAWELAVSCAWRMEALGSLGRKPLDL